MKSPPGNALEVSDPTEWLETPLSGLAPVDAAVRCQVCKDFFTTPMMTSCSHTFCSICIRRCLATDGKCPTCRASEQEIKLRRNWAVDDIVKAFRDLRDKALEFARQPRESAVGDERNSHKRKLDDLDSMDLGDANPQKRMTRSQSRRGADAVATESPDAREQGSYKDDGLVACPLCGRRMKEQSVYSHLDRCEDERRQQEVSTSDSNTRSSRPAPATALAQRPAPPQNHQRLPKLSYSLFKERDLRRKLTELGIRATGPKALLEKRHTEWVNLWNANCDSAAPRSKREVLQELDLWERSQGSLAPASAGPGSAVMRKDFERAAWAANHHDDYRALIANAKQRRGHPKKDAAEPPEGGGQAAGAEAATGDGEVDQGKEARPRPPSDDPRDAALRPSHKVELSELEMDMQAMADEDISSPQLTPDAPDLSKRPSDPSPAQPKFLASSPKKRRMFEDVDDPIVDLDSHKPAS